MASESRFHWRPFQIQVPEMSSRQHLEMLHQLLDPETRRRRRRRPKKPGGPPGGRKLAIRTVVINYRIPLLMCLVLVPTSLLAARSVSCATADSAQMSTTERERGRETETRTSTALPQARTLGSISNQEIQLVANSSSDSLRHERSRAPARISSETQAPSLTSQQQRKRENRTLKRSPWSVASGSPPKLVDYNDDYDEEETRKVAVPLSSSSRSLTQPDDEHAKEQNQNQNQNQNDKAEPSLQMLQEDQDETPLLVEEELEQRRRIVAEQQQQHQQAQVHQSSAISNQSAAQLNDSFLSAFFSHIDKQWKFAEIVLIIAISATLNLVTIVGNIMVLISFKMDRSLQTVSNYFLLSLALADLLIGLISMPLYTLYLLLNYWPLGALMCDIWLAIDYLNSNAAVLNMLVISFDRYFSVTRPLTYRAKRTTKHAILMISFAWLLSLTIWTPAIFTYPYYKGRTVQGTDKCEIEFVKANTYLTFVTAILAFYIPVAIMIYLYWRIWLETKKRYRDLTTLFLVSGVGAAASQRPTRPPVHTCGPLGGAARSSATAARGLSKSIQARFAPNRQQQPSQKSPAEIASAVGSCRMTDMRELPCKEAPPFSQPPKSLEPSSGCDPKQADKQAATSAQSTEAMPSQSTATNSLSKQNETPSEQQVALVVKQCSGSAADQSDTNAKCKCSTADCKTTPPPMSSACKICQEFGAGARLVKPLRSGAACCCCCYCHCHCHCHSHSSAATIPLQFASQQLAQVQNQLTDKKANKNCCYYPMATCSCCCAELRGAKTQASNKRPEATAASEQQVDNAANNNKCHKSGSKTSLYQFISDAASSPQNRCRIHPTKNAQTQEQEVHKREDSSKLLVDAATSPVNFPDLLLACPRASSEQSTRSQEREATTASLPVAVQAPQQQQQQQQQQQPKTPTSPEPEDFETRIVSHGDSLRFETNDPKLVGASSRSSSNPSQVNKQRCCKAALHNHNHPHPHPHHHHHHHHHHQQTSSKMPIWASCQASTSHKHHHHSQLKSTAGGTCCCADVISAHDAECKFCRPTAKLDLYRLVGHNSHGHGHHQQHAHEHSSGANHHHNHNHNHRHRHRHRHSHCKSEHCPKRSRSDRLTATGPTSEQYKLNLMQADKLASQQQVIRNDEHPGSSLPILSALQHQQTGNSDVQAHATQAIQLQSISKRPRRNPKKFSQKLTFSDILMERSNSCITLEGEQHQMQEAGRGENSRKDYYTKVTKVGNANKRATSLRKQQEGLEEEEASEPEQVNASSWLYRLWPDFLRPARKNRPVRYKTETISYKGAGEGEQEHKAARVESGRWYHLCCGGPSAAFSSSPSPSSRQMIKRFSSNDDSNSGCPRAGNPQDLSPSESEARQHERICSQSHGIPAASSSSTTSSGKSGQLHNANQHHHPIQPKSERKAAKTLSTLLLVFIVTWLPYNVLVLIKTLSGGEGQVPEKIWNFSYYLCYINSTINPLCYALCNAQFRRTYMRILKCKLSNEHSSTRRLVPIQSSSTWNKDLRLNSSSAGDCSSNSIMSRQQQKASLEMAASVGGSRSQQLEARPTDKGQKHSSSDSSSSRPTA